MPETLVLQCQIAKAEVDMYLLVLIVLGVVSLAVIWQVHEYQRRVDARANDAGKPNKNDSRA